MASYKCGSDKFYDLSIHKKGINEQNVISAIEIFIRFFLPKKTKFPLEIKGCFVRRMTWMRGTWMGYDSVINSSSPSSIGVTEELRLRTPTTSTTSFSCRSAFKSYTCWWCCVVMMLCGLYCMVSKKLKPSHKFY